MSSIRRFPIASVSAALLCSLVTTSRKAVRCSETPPSFETDGGTCGDTKKCCPFESPNSACRWVKEGHRYSEPSRLGARLGMTHLYIKDESLNPTGSFKARGLCLAVSMAKQVGVEELAIPSAGNAGGAMAAYAARAGLPSHVVMPRDMPRANVAEYEAYGADIRFVDGVITDAGRLVSELSSQFGWI